MSIKLKMTLWYTLLMVIIMAVMLGFIYYVYQQTAELEAQRRLNMVLRNSAEKLSFSGGELLYYDGEQWVADGLPAMEYGVYLQAYYYNAYGILEWTKPESDALPDMNFRTMRGNRDTLTAEDGTVYYYAERFIDVEPYISERDASWEASGEMASREMVSGEPSDFYGRGERGSCIILMGFLPATRLGLTVTVLAVTLPLLVVLAALGGWLMAQNALAPVGKIAASAREISGGEDLSRRIDIGSGKDELHQLARTMNDMLDRLEKSFLAERQFTSDASHELRTPTAVILAECDMAQKAATTPEEFRESLAVIQRQGQKMSALLGALLSYTRREQGTERPELEQTDLSELTEAICREQNRISRRGISLSMDIETAVTVLADVSLIMSLIQNLITNAYKYGRENGHIWVSMKAEGESAVLRVKDDGIGIPENCQELIWNRFYQVDPARSNQDGSLGLGLSMARQIAQLHGGSLQVQSVEGEGSEFIFTMPLDMKKA